MHRDRKHVGGYLDMGEDRKGERVLNGYVVSFWGFGNVLELNRGYSYTVNVHKCH